VQGGGGGGRSGGRPLARPTFRDDRTAAGAAVGRWGNATAAVAASPSGVSAGSGAAAPTYARPPFTGRRQAAARLRGDACESEARAPSKGRPSPWERSVVYRAGGEGPNAGRAEGRAAPR